MRLEQLEYLHAVTRHGSLRQASAHLHLSQPALSEALAKLERELGVALLDRHRSGARISWQGRELLPQMTAVLDAVDRLRTAAGGQRTSGRLVTVGTVSAATATLLVPALAALHQTHPTTSVDVRDLTHDEVLQGLREGRVDLGLVNVLDPDELPDDLRCTPVLQGRPVALLPQAHRLADKTTVTIDDLRTEPFILMRKGYLMHRLAHRIFGDELPQWIRSADGAEMGKVMVAEGLGATIFPEFSIVGDPFDRSGLVAHRPIEDADATVTLAVVVPRDAYPSEPTQALTDTLISQAPAITARAVHH